MTILAIITTGCATSAPLYKPFKLSEFEIQEMGFSYADFIHVGDQIKVHTNEAKQYDFQVTSIDRTYIRGKDIQLPLADISSVDRNLNEINGSVIALDVAMYLLMEDLLEHIFDNLFDRLF